MRKGKRKDEIESRWEGVVHGMGSWVWEGEVKETRGESRGSTTLWVEGGGGTVCPKSANSCYTYKH